MLFPARFVALIISMLLSLASGIGKATCVAQMSLPPAEAPIRRQLHYFSSRKARQLVQYSPPSPIATSGQHNAYLNGWLAPIPAPEPAPAPAPNSGHSRYPDQSGQNDYSPSPSPAPTVSVPDPWSSMTADQSDEPPSEKGNNLSKSTIVGIVFGSLFAIILILDILCWMGCLGSIAKLMNDLNGLDLHTGIFSLKQVKTATNDPKSVELTTGSFTLRQIKVATNNFDPANKIGEGGFGPVYKGILSDGTIIAVKQLSAKSKQGNREFINEIGMISALHHPHLVKLYGCCIEGNQLLLVYEYMENNSLARALFGPEEQQLHLNWRKRHKICIGIARGLAYLHEESRLKIVHRDIKATNVLLDKNLVPKISDFGIAKLDEEDNTHISTRVTGTFGYMAPEYAMRGHLTDKADVYSFGVVLLEVVCGRSNTSINTKDASFYLLDWAKSLKEKGNLLELVDPRLESNYNKKEVMTAIDLALLCTNVVATERPSMSTVVSILEGKNYSGFNLVSDSSISKDKMNPKDISTGYGEVELVDMDVVWTGTSSSTSDLYPILLDTDYWLKRD